MPMGSLRLVTGSSYRAARRRETGASRRARRAGGGPQASATSPAVRLLVARMNSTPIRWIGSPVARYMSA